MKITAKFNSVCPLCNESIVSGSEIEYKKGQKGMHIDCYKKQQKDLREEKKREWNALPFRIGDKIEVLENIPLYSRLGKRLEEINVPKGTKGKISTPIVRETYRDGKEVKLIQVEEIARKGQTNQTKTGIFTVTLDQIKIVKKGRL